MLAACELLRMSPPALELEPIDWRKYVKPLDRRAAWPHAVQRALQIEDQIYHV